MFRKFIIALNVIDGFVDSFQSYSIHIEYHTFKIALKALNHYYFFHLRYPRGSYARALSGPKKTSDVATRPLAQLPMTRGHLLLQAATNKVDTATPQKKKGKK